MSLVNVALLISIIGISNVYSIRLTGSSGMFESPNYPSNYESSTRKVYKFTTANDIWVTCYDFELQAMNGKGKCRDFLKLVDSDSSEKFCGTDGPTNYKLTSSNRKIIFKSNSKKNFRGFKCTFESFDNEMTTTTALTTTTPITTTASTISATTTVSTTNATTATASTINTRPTPFPTNATTINTRPTPFPTNATTATASTINTRPTPFSTNATTINTRPTPFPTNATTATASTINTRPTPFPTNATTINTRPTPFPTNATTATTINTRPTPFPTNATTLNTRPTPFPTNATTTEATANTTPLPTTATTSTSATTTMAVSTLLQSALSAYNSNSCSTQSQNTCGCDVTYADSEFYTTTYGDYRVVAANGIPNHIYETGQENPNPNIACPHECYMALPLNPVKGSTYNTYDMGPVGISVSGGFFYNHLSNPAGSVAVYEESESFDICNGHSDESCRYHYHMVPKCLANETSCTLVGYMRDGFPVYTYCYHETEDRYLKSCYYLTSGDGSDQSHYTFDETAYANGDCDLDQANGYTFSDERGYSYIFTEDYPYIMAGYYGTTVSNICYIYI